MRVLAEIPFPTNRGVGTPARRPDRVLPAPSDSQKESHCRNFRPLRNTVTCSFQDLFISTRAMFYFLFSNVRAFSIALLRDSTIVLSCAIFKKDINTAYWRAVLRYGHHIQVSQASRADLPLGYPEFPRYANRLEKDSSFRGSCMKNSTVLLR